MNDPIPSETSNARRWLIAITVAVVAVALIVPSIFLIVDLLSGFGVARQSARLLTAQENAAVRSECVTAYRGEWQNAVGDIVLVASRGNDPSEEQVRALAAAQRQSLRLNDLCDPSQPGGVVLPDPQETP
jgi:uncharacterized protein YnzC (UPF0291/DUF896 family)